VLLFYFSRVLILGSDFSYAISIGSMLMWSKCTVSICLEFISLELEGPFSKCPVLRIGLTAAVSFLGVRV